MIKYLDRTKNYFSIRFQSMLYPWALLSPYPFIFLMIAAGGTLSVSVAFAQPDPGTDLEPPPGLTRPFPATVAKLRLEGKIPEQDSSKKPKIVGGKDAKEGQFKWQVALILGSGDPQKDIAGLANAADLINHQYCGGSLIKPRWVLTAAHCTYWGGTSWKIPHKRIYVYVGSHDFTGGELIAIKRIIRHDGFDPLKSYDNDIALLELQSEPRDKSRVECIDLVEWPKDKSRLAVGAFVTLLGWGSTVAGVIPEDERKSVQTLQYIDDAQIHDSAKCNESLVEYQYKYKLSYYMKSENKTYEKAKEKAEEDYPPNKQLVTKNMICAGTANGTQDTCNGDSGGPLVVYNDEGKLVQAGIVSWGPEHACALTGLHSVQVRLSRYLDWIASQMKSPDDDSTQSDCN